MQLDRYYNIKETKGGIYTDEFDEIIDLIVEAKESGKISEDETKLLLEITFRRQNKVEIKNFFNGLFKNSNNRVKQTLMLHLKTNKTLYVR